MSSAAEPDESALEERILAEALGELGETAGGFGGLFSGGLAGGLGGRRGGRRGAAGAAALLRVDRGEHSLELPLSPGEVLQAARDTCAPEGRILDSEEIPAEPPQLWALVGSGAGGLNPALVRVIAEPLAGGGCRVVVRAVAKEGLIKQRAGQKTAVWAREGLLRAQPS